MIINTGRTLVNSDHLTEIRISGVSTWDENLKREEYSIMGQRENCNDVLLATYGSKEDAQTALNSLYNAFCMGSGTFMMPKLVNKRRHK
jgi:hypothetical protein